MSKYTDERNKKTEEIKKIGEKFQEFIRNQFADDPDFENAVNETNNENNNNFILSIFGKFGSWIRSISSNYTVQQPTQMSLDELKLDLKNKLETVLSNFSFKITSEMDELCKETLIAIEQSEFLTEIVTNPNCSVRKAKKEIRSL